MENNDNQEINKNEIVSELYNLKNVKNKTCKALISDFISCAKDFEEKSNHDYQLENNILLNKISLKGYILESDLCDFLEQNSVNEYNINYLKSFLPIYENNTNSNMELVEKAIFLYEKLENIENEQKEAIELLLINMEEILNMKLNYGDKEKENANSLYQNAFLKINEMFKNGNLNEEMKNKSIEIINEIFNYYVTGNTIIYEQE